MAGKESFKPKKISLGDLKTPGGSGHYQGPSGMDAEVKRNRSSQREIFSLACLKDLEAAGGSWGLDTVRNVVLMFILF